jgi:hypothetical protein
VTILELRANPIFHRRMKHVDVDYHFVRKQVSKRLLDVRSISTNDQVADIMIKPLSYPLFNRFRSNLNIVELSSD